MNERPYLLRNLPSPRQKRLRFQYPGMAAAPGAVRTAGGLLACLRARAQLLPIVSMAGTKARRETITLGYVASGMHALFGRRAGLACAPWRRDVGPGEVVGSCGSGGGW